MKPIVIAHSSYQDSTLLLLQKHYSGDVFIIVNDDWSLVAKFWMTDLSSITTMLQDCYSAM